VKVNKEHIMSCKIENPWSLMKLIVLILFFCWFARTSFVGQCGHKDIAIEMVA
jgi:hypothetical protein